MTRYILLFALLALALAQRQSSCPGDLLPCGGACFDPDDYCCPNEQLTQKQFCTDNEVAPTKGSSCPGDLLPCGAACYDEDDYCCSNGELTQKMFCGSNNTPAPSTDICASKSCATGQSCCPTTYGATCNNPSSDLTCRYDDLGNANLCAPEEIACGQACFPISSYMCVNGKPQPRTLTQLPGPNFVGNPSFEDSYFFPWTRTNNNGYDVIVVDGGYNSSKALSVAASSAQQTLLAPYTNLTLSFYVRATPKSSADAQYLTVSFNGFPILQLNSEPAVFTQYQFSVDGSRDGRNTISIRVSSDGRPFLLDEFFLGVEEQ